MTYASEADGATGHMGGAFLEKLHFPTVMGVRVDDMRDALRQVLKPSPFAIKRLRSYGVIIFSSISVKGQRPKKKDRPWRWDGTLKRLI